MKEPFFEIILYEFKDLTPYMNECPGEPGKSSCKNLSRGPAKPLQKPLKKLLKNTISRAPNGWKYPRRLSYPLRA